MNDCNFGFRIIKPLQLKDWKSLVVDELIPLTEMKYCPGDSTTELRVLVTLIGEQGARRMRIGWCSDCGYIGYIDRPTQDWMKNFYLSGTWDNGAAEKIPEKNMRRITNMTGS